MYLQNLFIALQCMLTLSAHIYNFICTDDWGTLGKNMFVKFHTN